MLLQAVAGIIGTILAVTGIMDYFIQFLTVLTTAIPPVGGVIIADYWIINKGKKENFTPKEGVNWNWKSIPRASNGYIYSCWN
ncbi:MAG: cytosine permease [Clostridium sp.]